MEKKPLKELTYAEKLYLFAKLCEHYNNEWGEKNVKKALVIDLFLKAVQLIYEKEQRELSDKELVDILMATYSPDYLESIIDKDNPEQELWIKTWIGCIYWILEWDEEVFAVEMKELAWE